MTFDTAIIIVGGIALIIVVAIVLAFAIDTALDLYEWWTGR